MYITSATGIAFKFKYNGVDIFARPFPPLRILSKLLKNKFNKTEFEGFFTTTMVVELFLKRGTP